VTQESKPRIFSSDLAQLPTALQWLTKQPRWVLWRWVMRVTAGGKGKWTKPPYQPAFPNALAKSNDPSTWGSYQEALAVVAAGKADGIGVMLLEGELAAADLDRCRDPATGKLSGWAMRLCVEADQLGLYREITVSGCGLRFIGFSHQGAELHKRFAFHRSGEGLELYRNCARFITISGLQEGQCETMGEIDGYLDELLARFTGQPAASQSATLLDLNTAGPQQTDYYREILENGANEGERSERFAEVVWHLASTGMSIEEIVDELTSHPNGIGAKYAKRLFAEVDRCFSKWKTQRLAAVTGMTGGSATIATPAAANLSAWPQIKVIPSELPRIVNEAEDALILLGQEFYQRGGLLVRPVTGTIVKRTARRRAGN